jgi:hypothetical protein
MISKRETGKAVDMSDYAAIPVMAMEFNAGEEARRMKRDEDFYMSVGLTELQVNELDGQLGEAAMLIRDAGEFLSFLSIGLACGHFDANSHGISAILRLSERAFRAAEDREVRILENLECSIRRDMAKAIDRRAMAGGGS